MPATTSNRIPMAKVLHCRPAKAIAPYHVDIFVTRAYHGAAKMTRRAFIFDAEFILTMCLG